MSLLDRLGRPNQLNIQVRIFASRSAEPIDNSYHKTKLQIHQRIVAEMTPAEQMVLSSKNQDIAEIERIIDSYVQKVMDENPFAIPRGERVKIVNELRDEMLGLGPLESLLKDDSITEIMVNGAKKIFVERLGKLTLTDIHFHDNEHLMNIIERILSPLGRRIDEASPLVDARLDDGSRVNIIIPPLSLVGPVLTIRKFSRTPLTFDNLINFGTLNRKMASFLQLCVNARINILVSGGTGSGKTTTLNALSSFIPSNERIVTIEDAAELQLQQPHVVTLESRPANIEGKGQITIRDLVRNALRMRPDRIIVGEVRSGEALDMLQAMNTGHDGSLTTAHANSPRDVLSRLETMVLMSGFDLPVRAIREQISSAIDLIVHQGRIKDGSRKITHITEVQHLEGDIITTQDLFYYEMDGIDDTGKAQGHFNSTGLLPSFMEKFHANGVELPPDLFQNIDTAKGDF
ncbi:MAG: CpaF family protein [Anaerovibrio sp.]|uniref:CpaF family protein n=1 Tax=Anaerovibrio sp. TaxID=1872532 RepID=UPI0025EF6FD2|nr:CpaF family protein [Anaerovibrio sp.]MCR5177124.1 CpaF family protein [Anaerovibrio sp.]